MSTTIQILEDLEARLNALKDEVSQELTQRFLDTRNHSAAVSIDDTRNYLAAALHSLRRCIPAEKPVSEKPRF